MASTVTRIHAGKTPQRIHFIAQWAKHRNMRQVDIVRGLPFPTDKGTVSRWFKGALPSEAGLIGLAGLFECEVNDLFRDPADDWLKRFFEDRKPEEIERIRATLEVAFPKKATS